MIFNFRHQQTNGSSSNKPASLAGKAGLTLFFSVFFGMGLLFEVLLVREIAGNIASRFWPQVPCTILNSSVENGTDSESPYLFKVKYEYSYQGQKFQSDRYQKNKTGFSDYSKSQKLAESYPFGFKTFCHVNPKNPGEAILKHDSLWLGCFIVIPTLFVIIGGGGIYGIWFYKNKEKIKKPKAKAASSKKNLGGLGLIVFGFIFFAAGMAISYFLLIRPLVKSFHARTWIQTPCKVISARVQNHDSDDGTTYSADILYEYIVDDKPYRSNEYDFIGGSSSGYDSKKAVVDRYQTMRNPVCYVNPDDPHEAVLIRDVTWKNAIGLFPLIFVVTGLGVMAGGISSIHKSFKTPLDRQWLPEMPGGQKKGSDYQKGYYTVSGNTIILKPQLPMQYKFFGILLACVFWNGIVSVFVVHMVGGFRSGRPEWCLTLFLIPFELVGLGLIGAAAYQFLAIFNPRFELTLQPDRLYPASSAELNWIVKGRASRIRRMTIKLIGREEAVYQRGTNTQTDKKVFFEKELFGSDIFNEIREGQVRIEIPAETMHSFESTHNKIVWMIEVHGDIARWPDVKQEYKITINPKPIVS